MENNQGLREKLEQLKARLRNTSKLAVSFSGGVDSALLLKIAVEAMGPERVVAITARGANFPEREFDEATGFAKELGVEHICIDFDALSLPEFVENSPERCYHCKKALLGAVMDIARKHGAESLADGANIDDMGDYRPGMRATGELGVISPLRDAGMGKREIRQLLREYDFSGWDKPSLACLASRIPYGQSIGREDLERVDRAERYLLDLGFKNVRVRHHGNLARIEVEAEELGRFLDGQTMARTASELKRLGYAYVTLDLQGYRTGSMNEEITPDRVASPS